jgi:diaminohydroxyphosphoribosylaminopyrimidine deaminase/5-amino-6-(5-phosphoribosylamino)uracil reductase
VNYDALMAEAIELALRGRGQVEPNPRVGALALHAGQVVGRGWHRAYGEAHAEAEALAEAARVGATVDTVVVTLEPCSADKGVGGKKREPCVAALRRAGVARVVLGAIDADPRHRGRAVALLREAGVAVVEGVLAERCAALNRPFARWLTLDRPWTIAKWAMSLDGKIATASGESRWISGATSRRAVHELRARVDAVLIGYRTALRDDPQLTVRDVPGTNPRRIVVDPEAALPLASRLVQTLGEAPLTLLVSESADPARVAALTARGVECLRVAGPGRELDLAAAWRDLRARGVRRLLVEGGGGLFAKLFARDLIDQALVYVAPKVLGGASAPTPVAGPGIAALAQATTFAESFCTTSGDDALVVAIRA